MEVVLGSKAANLGAKRLAFVAILIALLLLPICLLCQTSDRMQKILDIEEATTAGDLDTASRLIGVALNQYPRDGGLLNLRGVVHARRNEVAEARQDFTDAVRFSPALTPAWQNLARACQILADQDASAVACAINSWERVSTLKPDDAEAHASLGMLLERSGEFSKSLMELRKLPAGIASQTPNLLLLCADLAALGRTVEAQKAAAQIGARTDFSDADFGQVQNAFDSAVAASVVIPLVETMDNRGAAGLASLRRLAIAYEQTNRIADARRTLERIVLLDPHNTAHLLELARLADNSKDYEAALGYLAHARDLEPQNARIHFLFAMIAAKMELPLEAKRSLERALTIDPENPDYNYSMGVSILASRDAATAAGFFEKFLKARPASASGHFALGVAYFNSGDYDKARTEMLQLENGPKSGNAEYFLGRIARLEGDTDGALRHLQKSIDSMPSFAESHTELARVYMLQGDLERAHAELDRAVKLDPQSFQANNQLFILYKRTHDGRAAAQQQLLAKLDEERSRRAELMLRTVEFRP
ncbi:MAG: tetratricopeptide repeat protein [Acidobacteriaceae bacterium]|nr:tetratricopeptide repeat protein [Acidobacteriaceae bacterium]